MVAAVAPGPTGRRELRGWSDSALDDSLVAFGDDGTGGPFCVRPGDGGRVCRWSFIDGAIVEDMSFGEFEAEWLSA